MAERKRVKGKKPTETMRQRQQRLLREQRAARNKNVRSQKALTSKTTTGGRRYPTGTASSRRAQAAAKQARAAQGTKGPNRVGQPAGAANRRYGADRVARSVRRAQVETAVRGASRRIGRGGPAVAGAIGMELASKLAQTIGQPGQSRMSRLGIQGPAKPKVKASPKAKPKAKSSQSTKSGMTPAQVKKAQAKANADRRAGKLSNIPTPKAKVKAKPKTKTQRAYAADARNKEYDKLRKAGKVKEAEALGKKIAADARKKAPKNPYRVPQGGERKDRLSKQVKELKGMGKKKKKQSRANQAGYPGNRNY